MGKSEIITQGEDLTIVAIGKMVAKACNVANTLKKEYNIETEVINARFLKPLDDETIINSARKTKKVITIEDNVILGGFGSNVLQKLNEKQDIKDIKIKILGYPNEYIKQGKVEQIEEKYGLDQKGILQKCLNLVENEQ